MDLLLRMEWRGPSPRGTTLLSNMREVLGVDARFVGATTAEYPENAALRHWSRPSESRTEII
jgi:hypothetical protein